MTRRRLLAVLAALPLAGRASAAPAAIEVLDGERLPTLWRGGIALPSVAPKGTTLIPAATGEDVAVRRRMRGRVRAIDSIANANDRYQIELVLAGQPHGEAWLLDTSGRAVRSRGTTEGDVISTWFDVDRPTADVLAGASGVARRDRAPEIDGLTGHWSAPATASLGQPITVTLTVANVGNRPVTVSFGPLESSFHCTIAGIARIEGMYTGPLAIRELAAGASFSFTADLRNHAKLTAGTHDVACELALVAFAGSQYPARASERWDAPLRGTVRIAVR